MVPAMLLRAKRSVRRCGVTETARTACSSGACPASPNEPAEVPHEGSEEQDGEALADDEHDPGERHETAQGHERPASPDGVAQHPRHDGGERRPHGAGR